jgi:hypothetical protein
VAREDDDLRHRADHGSRREARCSNDDLRANCTVADGILVAAMDDVIMSAASGGGSVDLSAQFPAGENVAKPG